MLHEVRTSQEGDEDLNFTVTIICVLSSDDIRTVVLISGSVNSAKLVVPRLLGDSLLWTQHCELPQRSLAAHSVLVGQQMQGWDSDWGLWTQKKARQAGYLSIYLMDRPTPIHPSIHPKMFNRVSFTRPKPSCFVFQVVSLWLELTSRSTWSTSAHTRPSPWRTWWCPRTPCCWAGSRNRPPDLEWAPSTSSPGTLWQRDSLHPLWLRWMRNYSSAPLNLSQICIVWQEMPKIHTLGKMVTHICIFTWMNAPF